MSRHRFVRNMALEGHLDDESLSDGGEDDMTPEQHLQLATAASKVRDILGPEDESGFTDEQISDTVWNKYFDVEASVDHLLKDKARKEAARERKDPTDATPPPAPPVSALQRLSLARMESKSQQPKPSLASLAASATKPPSKLAALAKSSATAPRPSLASLASQSSSVTKPSLSALAQAKTPQPSKLGLAAKAAASASPVSSPAPSSKLAAIAAKHRASQASPQSSSPSSALASSPVAVSHTPPLSKLAARAAALSASPPSPRAGTPSKLAAKVQSLRASQAAIPEPEPEPVRDASLMLLFNPVRTVSAQPSRFGSILSVPCPRAPPLPESQAATARPVFSFNVPSPDDVVMEARRGTSLAALVPSTSLRAKAMK